MPGIGRRLQGWGGAEHHTITVSGEGNLIFSRMHKPQDEKRAVVILRPEDREEWLTTLKVEAARAMLGLYPANEMFAEAK